VSALEPGIGPPAPVPILQWQREFETLLQLFDRLEPRRVLEVGTYHGGTLYHWLQNARAGTTVVSVDSYAAGVDNRHLYYEWPRNDDVEVIPIEGDSHAEQTVKKAAAFGPYDWTFIDAGHYYSEVEWDWRNYRALTSSPGVVCLHDIILRPDVHPEIEVGLLWEEIRAEHRTLEIVADREAPWGGIGVVLL